MLVITNDVITTSISTNENIESMSEYEWASTRHNLGALENAIDAMKATYAKFHGHSITEAVGKLKNTVSAQTRASELDKFIKTAFAVHALSKAVELLVTRHQASSKESENT